MGAPFGFFKRRAELREGNQIGGEAGDLEWVGAVSVDAHGRDVEEVGLEAELIRIRHVHEANRSGVV